jgi:hypothetical protein
MSPRKPQNFEFAKSTSRKSEEHNQDKARRPITAALMRVGESKLPERERKQLGLWPGATWFDAIAVGMFRATIRGDVAAAREIREAIEGKAPLLVELTGGIVLADVVRKLDERVAA